MIFCIFAVMNTTDPYANLKKELDKNKSWPILYMFKFIIPADIQKLALVESKFSTEAVVTKRESTNGKFISITIREVMLSSDSIIDKYKEMEGIENLMSL